MRSSDGVDMLPDGSSYANGLAIDAAIAGYTRHLGAANRSPRTARRAAGRAASGVSDA
jgi:hypothetical protein